MKNIVLFKLSLIFLFSILKGQDINFPHDAGHINLVEEYGLVGDGTTDNTLKFQQALDENWNQRVIFYLPNGEYLVSNTLEYRWEHWDENKDGYSWGPYLIGENRENTIIRLADNAQGFDNAFNPKGVIKTGEKVAQKFSKQIRNLTINTGSGNPAAYGIIFYSNNEGMISDINVISGDGQGLAGIHTAFSNENGPLLIRNSFISGFETGITTGSLNSQTISNVTIENVSVAGLKNNGIVSIEGLQCNNIATTAVINQGTMSIISSNFTGTNDAVAAIQNSGKLFARNISSTGYQKVLETNQNYSQIPSGDHINEFVSSQIYREFKDADSLSLNLDIEYPPVVSWDDTTEWVSITDYGAIPNDKNDDSEAMQQAIDAGFKTVYFPKGDYKIEDTVYIRGEVKRIHGMSSNLGGGGRFILTSGTHPEVIIEAIKWERLHTWTVENNSSRTLLMEGVINHLLVGNGTGKIFISDILTRIQLNNPDQKLWARHLNTEGQDNVGYNIHNNGSTLWILGLKTEKDGTKIYTENHGNTELIGAHIYPQCNLKVTPLFESVESNCSFAGVRTLNYCSPCRNYSVFVRETKNGVTSDFLRSEVGPSCGETFMLYTSDNNCLYDQKPGALQNIQYSVISLTELKLSWDNISDQADGIVIVGGLKDQVAEEIAIIDAMNSEYLIKNLTAGSDYEFKLVGYNCMGYSDTTKINCATPEEVTIPDNPSNFEANAIQWNQIELSWTDNAANENGFIIERRTSGVFTKIAELAEDVTSYLDNNLEPLTTYTYRMHAHNFAGISEYQVTSTQTPDQQVSLNTTTELTARLYPNPVSENLYIETKEFASEEVHYSISDLSGRVCLDGILVVNERLSMINLERLQTGTYFLKLSAGKKSEIHQFMIVR